MSKENYQFKPFGPYNFMALSSEKNPAPMPMFPMPNFEAMNNMAFQAMNQKFNQMQAYFCQMAQTGATMLSQLYMEHVAMVQKAAEQDKELMKQFEKVMAKKDDEAEKTEKSAEKMAEKSAEKKSEKKTEKKAEKESDK